MVTKYLKFHTVLDKHILRHLLNLKVKKEEKSYKFTLYMIPLTVVHVNLLYTFWRGLLIADCVHITSHSTN